MLCCTIIGGEHIIQATIVDDDDSSSWPRRLMCEGRGYAKLTFFFKFHGNVEVPKGDTSTTDLVQSCT